MITLKQKVNNVTELNPLLLNIEKIHSLDLKIQVTDTNKNIKNTGNE